MKLMHLFEDEAMELRDMSLEEFKDLVDSTIKLAKGNKSLVHDTINREVHVNGYPLFKILQSIVTTAFNDNVEEIFIATAADRGISLYELPDSDEDEMERSEREIQIKVNRIEVEDVQLCPIANMIFVALNVDWINDGPHGKSGMSEPVTVVYLPGVMEIYNSITHGHEEDYHLFDYWTSSYF